MQESTQRLIQAFPGRSQLLVFGERLLEWLNKDLSPHGEPLTESRARALLLANNVLDEPTRNSFTQLVEADGPTRIAFYDLLRESGLAENEELGALAATSAVHAASPKEPGAISWLALAVAAHAWRSDFLLDRLDPAYPPDPYSPAGQVIKRAAYFLRQQVQRSATERDKLSRKLAFDATAGAATLNTLQADTPVAPLPPHYRPPVPVRYPEYSPAVQVDPGELEHTPPAVARAEPIRLDDADLAPQQPPTQAPSPPITQPAIRIDASQLEPPPAPRPPSQPTSSTIMPSSTASVNTTAASAAARRGRSRRGTTMKPVKLRIVVQEHPDGPGLYGLQVRVSSRGVRRYVAGTTNRDGEFLCELPVQLDSGLTYDVDVTWPRDYGGDVERKSITLNADRTQFVLPFYRTLKT